jgi:two-component system chemotaxis response regulator CheY
MAPLKIMVVDDSAVTRTMISDFLQMLGHTVVGEAENLAQVLAVHKNQTPDMVTLDLSMEEEDGFVVLSALRKIDKNVKVLIVSANTQQDIVDQLFKDGASGFLSKPFTIDDLGAAIAKAAVAQ